MRYKWAQLVGLLKVSIITSQSSTLAWPSYEGLGRNSSTILSIGCRICFISQNKFATTSILLVKMIGHCKVNFSL